VLSLQNQGNLYLIDMTFKHRLRAARKAVKPKLTQLAVAQALGVTPQAVSGWERGDAMPEPGKLPDLALLLKTDVNTLLGKPTIADPSLSQHGNGTIAPLPPTNVTPSSQGLKLVPVEAVMGAVDLPVFSTVQGGRGALVLSSEPFRYVARPHTLLGIQGGYGVLVKGDSMAREYNENDIAYVNPHLHPKKGDPCVFQNRDIAGEVTAIIKYLERSPDANDTLFYVSQTNPPRKFTIRKADWQLCHVAVGKVSGRE
jgi:DNA-binding XRE family transcriptional regulator